MKKCVTLAAVLLVVGGAFAATSTYDTESDFLANVMPGYYLEGFGSPSSSYVTDGTYTDSTTYSWTVSSIEPLYVWGDDIASGTPCVGALGTDGPDAAMTITFTGAPVTAFGGNLYLTNIYFQAVTGSMTVALDDGTSVELDSPYADSFTGFTSDTPITSVTLTPNQDSEYYTYATIDNIVVGTAVPEPSSLALLGLGAVVLWRRR